MRRVVTTERMVRREQVESVVWRKNHHGLGREALEGSQVNVTEQELAFMGVWVLVGMALFRPLTVYRHLNIPSL